MKRTIAILLSYVLLMTCLGGCAHNTALGPENPVTLTMWHVYGSQTKSPLNDLINEFNRTVGKENGITINVESVTSSSAIDKALHASVNGEPGAENMPDLFTAYPRVVEFIGEEKLLSWNDYFTEKELSDFQKNFLSEGYFNEKLLMLPVAKSTEALYLNKTLFDRFSADTDVSVDDLNTFEGVFDVARKYYDWSNGQNFMQINDYYNFSYVGMKSYNSEFIRNGRLRLDDDAFESIWIPLAKTAIYGGICLEDGYAASRWKTVEIIANTGSTADVLYQPTEVIYSDNTTESIEAIALPYPTFTVDTAGAIYRGGGLFAVKNKDERKNQAAYIFAKWLTEKEHNLDFVTKAGYIPVTVETFDALFSDLSLIEQESYRSVYRAVGTMQENYTFYALPLYSGASDIQLSFEKNVKTVLTSAHSQYIKRVSNGENPTDVLNELVVTSLNELKQLSAEQGA
ncbi:MAG: carbohydrate ABC transporter substrate-binding protein [Lachnospiraceae bacterium]|nr:carbohydrate ABC transporter substrate-binding protein [Lachnospiraceae bacterium]